jgi:hypothetical protein
MSDIAIFGAGSIMFIATTWATIAFGVRRMHELQDEELERTGRTPLEGESGLTELHVDADRNA